MKKIIVLILVILVFSCCISVVYSHSGRTDSSGGHYDKSTGEYHYHHGYSAHQHPNGVCPYEESETVESPEPVISSETLIEQTTGEFSFPEDDYEIIINGLREEISDLENEVYALKAEIDYNDSKLKEVDMETIDDLVSKVKESNDDFASLCLVFVILLIVGIVVSYHVGKSKEKDKEAK